MLHLLQLAITRGILTIMLVIGVAWTAGFLLILGGLAVSVWEVLGL